MSPPLADEDEPCQNAKRILHLIRQCPGIHKARICRCLGLAWGTVDYHVHRLTRAGYVHGTPVGRVVAFLPDTTTRRHPPLFIALHNPLATAILEALRYDGPSGTRELARRLDATRHEVRGAVRHLQRAQLVRRRHIRDRLHARPTSSLAPRGNLGFLPSQWSRWAHPHPEPFRYCQVRCASAPCSDTPP